MDEKEKQPGDFDLDDILKEFAGDTKDIPEEVEDILIWDGILPAKTETTGTVISDTVRLDEISRAIKQQEESVTDETVAFTPVGQAPEEEIYTPPVPQTPQVEPYSEAWEPEYEQPIGE